MLKATHTITGSYTQGASALLVIGVIDPTHYGQVVITGNASMTNDQVSITAVSGSLTNRREFHHRSGHDHRHGCLYRHHRNSHGFTASVSSITSGGF